MQHNLKRLFNIMDSIDSRKEDNFPCKKEHIMVKKNNVNCPYKDDTSK